MWVVAFAKTMMFSSFLLFSFVFVISADSAEDTHFYDLQEDGTILCDKKADCPADVPDQDNSTVLEFSCQPRWGDQLADMSFNSCPSSCPSLANVKQTLKTNTPFQIAAITSFLVLITISQGESWPELEARGKSRWYDYVQLLKNHHFQNYDLTNQM